MMSNESSVRGFAKQCANIVDGGFTTLNLLIGQRLGLFHVLAEYTSVKNPKTSQEIADKALKKERYIREWLKSLVVANVISCDPSGTKFWLEPYKAAVLTNPVSAVNSGEFLLMLGKVIDPVVNCFEIDGPRGISYDHYTDFHNLVSRYSSVYYEMKLIPDIIPYVSGLVSQLKSGINCLDIGCGSGVPGKILADNFPNSTFWGVDFSAQGIAMAKKNAKHLPNANYLVADAAQLNLEWTGTFDYLMAFDAIHDQAYPDKVLAEVFRVLKPGGYFSMIDITGTSNCYQDKSEIPSATMAYTASLFHCMPVSLYFKGGMGLGAMWGKQKAIEMLEKTGFIVEQVMDIPGGLKYNLHYICKKPIIKSRL